MVRSSLSRTRTRGMIHRSCCLPPTDASTSDATTPTDASSHDLVGSGATGGLLDRGTGTVASGNTE